MNMKKVASTLLLSATLGVHGNASALPMGYATFTCHVLNVAALENRVHVECAYNYGRWFYSVPLQSSSEAARLLSMGQIAIATNKPLYVMHDTSDFSAASFGCDPGNCRRPITIQLNK